MGRAREVGYSALVSVVSKMPQGLDQKRTRSRAVRLVAPGIDSYRGDLFVDRRACRESGPHSRVRGIQKISGEVGIALQEGSLFVARYQVRGGRLVDLKSPRLTNRSS